MKNTFDFKLIKGHAGAGRIALPALLCLLALLLIPAPIWANAAEPPSLVILVSDPPEDLSVVLISSENMPEAAVRKVAWEGYYAFYSRDLEAEGPYVFQVSVGQEQFTWSPEDRLQGYNNVYTLDVEARSFTAGVYPFRAAILVSMRVLLTLMIEGLVFLLFRFKERRSWRIFLAVNLATQGILNLWLNQGGSLMPSYLLIGLVIGEIVVFAVEMIALPLLIKEHKKSRTLLFAVAANLASLIAGGYILTVLPV
jgi:hypothetical protein